MNISPCCFVVLCTFTNLFVVLDVIHRFSSVNKGLTNPVCIFMVHTTINIYIYIYIYICIYISVHEPNIRFCLITLFMIKKYIIFFSSPSQLGCWGIQNMNFTCIKGYSHCYSITWDQIHNQFMSSCSKSCQMSVAIAWKNIGHIKIKFRTCHDSPAVMTNERLKPDYDNQNWANRLETGVSHWPITWPVYSPCNVAQEQAHCASNTVSNSHLFHFFIPSQSIFPFLKYGY